MNRPHVSMPPLGHANKYLLAFCLAIFLLHSVLKLAVGSSFLSYMSLNSSSFFSGHIYQLFTYPLIHHGLFEALFTMLIFCFIGGHLEKLWGMKRYLQFLAISSLIGGLIFLLSVAVFSSTGSFAMVSGLGALAGSLCLAYGILFPEQEFTFMFLFPIKAKYFCGLLIGIELYQAFFSGSRFAAIANLGALLGSFGYMLIVSNPRFKRLTKEVQELRLKKKIEKSHLKLVKDDDDKKPPKYWQ